MEPADLAAALRLSRASGWNQTEADWRFLLDANRGRFVVAERDGTVVGTGGASAYGGRLAWVCMILVEQAARGQGTGSAIVAEVLDRVADVEAVGLDATPAGRGVYERLGFTAVATLARVGGRADAAAAVGDAATTRRMEANDLEDVVALDREASGADRSHVIQWAFERSPALAWCVPGDGAIAGFALGRDGDRALHIGPVVARSVAAARAVVASAARSVHGRDLLIDVSTADPAWTAAVHDLGLRAQRPFARMYRRGLAPSGRPELTFAAFGPELG
jgi:GNAT superfamily N-acetyltransferase